MCGQFSDSLCLRLLNHVANTVQTRAESSLLGLCRVLPVFAGAKIRHQLRGIRRSVSMNVEVSHTLKMRFVSSQRSASLAPNDALHESSYKHFLDGVHRFAQKLLDKFHLTDGENLLVVKPLSLGGQEFIQFHTAFDFAGQTAHGILRFAVWEIHHRQYAASISCF